MRRFRQSESGFTMVEVLVVMLILAVLVLIAVPLYTLTSTSASRRTCFHNQNTLERATELYLAVNQDHARADLEGVVDSSHPVVLNHIVGRPPRCPSGAKPADSANPTAAEGAYTFTATGSISACQQGDPIKHGYYRD